MATGAAYKDVSSNEERRRFTVRTFFSATRNPSRADAEHVLGAQLDDEFVAVALVRVLPLLHVLLPLPKLRAMPLIRRLHLERCKTGGLRLIDQVRRVPAILCAFRAADECLVDRRVEGEDTVVFVLRAAGGMTGRMKLSTRGVKEKCSNTPSRSNVEQSVA